MPKHNNAVYRSLSPSKPTNTFFFDVEPNITNNGDIRDYEWTYDTRFSKIVKFRKELSTRTIRVTFYQRRLKSWDNSNELYTVPQYMYELFDRDIMMQKPGTLEINGYSINCYIIGSKKVAYNNDKVIKLDLTVLSDFVWRATESLVYGMTVEPEEPSDFDFLDYQYDYDYDYGVSGNANSTRSFFDKAFAPFKFRLIFTGPIENPEVRVGDNVYRVYTSVGEGERLEINSIDKTIFRIQADGTKINEFNNRERYAQNKIFDPMPITEDESEVVVPEGKQVEIEAHFERSEPPWI